MQGGVCYCCLVWLGAQLSSYPTDSQGDLLKSSNDTFCFQDFEAQPVNTVLRFDFYYVTQAKKETSQTFSKVGDQV